MRNGVLIPCILTALTCPRCAHRDCFNSDIIIAVQTDIGIPPDEQPTMLLCGSRQDFAVSLKTICNRGENQFTRGVEIQVFQPRIQIVIICLTEMQQSKPMLLPPTTSAFTFLRNKFLLENLIPPYATMC